jgi:hypothetical protein
LRDATPAILDTAGDERRCVAVALAQEEVCRGSRQAPPWM